MHYLIFAILCSVSVSVLLKVARKHNIVIEQAIAFNYIVALSLCYFLLKQTRPSDAPHVLIYPRPFAAT